MQIVPRLSAARIYRLPPWRRFTPLYPSLVVVGVLWIIILSTANTDVSAVLFVGLPLTGFFLLLGALICLTTINVHLELAPDGIMYEGTGYQVYSPWSNILEVDQVHYGFRQVDGVRLRLPAGEEVSAFHDFIPVGYYAPYSNASELWTTLHQQMRDASHKKP